jgi:hypothetical protein
MTRGATRTVLVLLLAAGTDAVATTALSPERILRDIEAEGARAVVDRLWTSGDYDRVLGHIDTGEPAWIALAPKLAPGAAAGSSDELTVALAYALPKNPLAVLAVLDPASPVIGPRNVCSAPFGADTDGEIHRYARRARAAIARVAGAASHEMKAACLAALRKL